MRWACDKGETIDVSGVCGGDVTVSVQMVDGGARMAALERGTNVGEGETE
jgi:hypothetical protein